ncbi:retrovirus-related Pol polyprotein from transposon 17.6 [Trichonephila clavipes]|nr:retrovirus-related Pol polyprotein from transposon 17.6 [Trichonephila clavipes]
MVRKKKRASNPRKNIVLTAKEIESSSSPNKISESHTSKMETRNEIKIKQEENLDADEEKLQQPITIIKNDIRFEDLQTFFQKYNLEIPIQTFIRNFESTCDSFNIPEKQKILFIIKLVDGAVKTYIQSQSIPKSFYELKNNLIREFGKQVNPAEIHLQLSKTEKTSKETHIEYFYRVKEIAPRINMEEAEKYYLIRGLRENRAIEIQLQSCSNIEELKEKMKLLDIQEKSKSNASKTAISCILKQQKPNGNQHPITFHSRRLRNYEINYTITELECLAIIDSLDKFQCYLHGSHFTVHTDHNALVWLKNFKNPTGRLFRWSLKVFMYDFDIKYKKGSTNVAADMLTRNPIAYHIINTPPEPLLDINEISHFQNIENTSAPKCFKRDAVFVVKRQGLTKIIVPKALRVKLMETHKKFGHPGVAIMLKLISPQLLLDKHYY